MVEAATGKPKAKGKTKPKPKLSNKERHKRFVEMARKVEADESAESFERAFQGVIPSVAPSKRLGGKPST
jgi:hypothetical protein